MQLFSFLVTKLRSYAVMQFQPFFAARTGWSGVKPGIAIRLTKGLVWRCATCLGSVGLVAPRILRERFAIDKSERKSHSLSRNNQTIPAWGDR